MVLLVNNELEVMWKEAVMVQFEIPSRHFSGDTDENCRNPQSESPVSGLKPECGTSEYETEMRPTRPWHSATRITEQVGIEGTLWTWIREVISAGAPTILTEVSLGSPRSLWVNARIVHRLAHGHFLPNPFQFIVCHPIIQRYIVSILKMP
jgi:hypothetical protein